MPSSSAATVDKSSDPQSSSTTAATAATSDHPSAPPRPTLSHAISYRELFSKVKNFLYNEEALKDSDENIVDVGATQHYVRLERKGFTSIPDFILESKAFKKELDVLILSYNNIKAIPPDILQLEELKVLDLSHNHQIRNFTFELMSLKNLKGLNLSYNSIEKIPDAFSDLMKNKMMVLNLNSNKIASIDNISWINLKTMIELDLADNQLDSVPDSICELVNLTQLDLSGNRLTTLPKQLYNLNKLKHVFLRRNRLKDLPKLPFESDPSQLSQNSIFYNMKGLETLEISHNYLTENDLNGIGDLEKITSYHLNSNDISMLSLEFGLKSSTIRNITSVNMSTNNLNELPIVLAEYLGEKLKELNVSNNHIKSLGDNFSKFKALETLNLTRNELEELPESLGSLTTLSDLKATHNFIKSIYPNCFNKNMLLRGIDLDYNFITELPTTIGELRELVAIRVEHNELKSIPNEIVKCENLRGIYAAYNELTTLPESIGNCVCLRKIHVGKLTNHILPSF